MLLRSDGVSRGESGTGGRVQFEGLVDQSLADLRKVQGLRSLPMIFMAKVGAVAAGEVTVSGLTDGHRGVAGGLGVELARGVRWWYRPDPNRKWQRILRARRVGRRST